jgi:anti-sigma-K factor RskA
MDPAPDCNAIIELIPEYAFGLTDPDDTRLVELGLASCPEAADQLADFQRIQAEMRVNVPQLEPSAQLGSRLMAAIAEPAPTVKTRRRLIGRISVAWLAAAIAVIALIGTNVYWALRVSDLDQQVNALVSNNNGIQDNGTQNVAFILTSTNHLRWVRLPPSEEKGDASAFMMWNAESKIGLLYARGFPKLVVGKTYQLWLTRGDEKISAGTFRVDEDGKGALLFHITEPIDKYTWARITAEPESGSTAPTGTPVVVGKLST